MRHALRLSAWLLVGAIALVGTPVVYARAPAFGDGSATSHDGAMLLKWDTDEPAVGFEVQHATDPGFGDARTIYSGTMPSAHVSGLRNGEHLFRVRARHDDRTWSAWSEPMRLEVEHHPMSLVWPLFGLGAAVFFCTLGFVVFQVRNQEGEG